MKTKTRAPRQTKHTRLKKSVEAGLRELARAELVRALSDAEPAYFFKHALVQDTAQSTLLHGEYRRLNLLVARAYEAIYVNRCMEEFAAVLAQHYAQAGDDAKTLTYAMRAGDLAASEYANIEAIAYYTQAVEAAKRSGATTAQFIHLFTKRGRVHEVQGDYERALFEYQELLTFAQARNDRALELGALMLQTTLRCGPMPTFEATLGKELAEQALALADELNDRAAEAKILWNLQLLSTHTQQPQRAVEYGERALAIAQGLDANGHDLREQIAYILNDLAMPYILTKNFERGTSANMQARELWRVLDNKPMLADNLGSSAQFLYFRGEFARAIEISTEGAAVASSIGNDLGVMFNRSFMTGCYFELGDIATVWREGHEVTRLAIRLGLAALGQAVSPGNFVLLAATLGEMELSREFDRRARAGVAFHAPEFFRALAYASLARASVLRGEWGQAVQDIATGRAYLTSNAQVFVWMQLAIAEAGLAVAQHEPTKALAAAESGIKIQQDDGYRLWLAELLYLRALALREMNQADAAWDSMQQARDAAETIHQRRMLWQIYAALSEMENERGNVSQANAYRAQARAVIEFIHSHSPQELRDSFLKLPRVREVLAQIEAKKYLALDQMV